MWVSELSDILARESCVVVTVVAITGSAPRAVGSRMLVTRDGLRGSIGGGNLEYKAIESAREMLESASAGKQQLALFGLGPELNQCCGGAVTISYEVYHDAPPAWVASLAEAQPCDHAPVLVSAIDRPMALKWLVTGEDSGTPDLPRPVARALAEFVADRHPATRLLETDEGRFLLESPRQVSLPVFLFGAGHVGNALVRVLGDLPFDLTWLDSRPGQFQAGDPARMTLIECADPAARVADCPPGGTYIVMTHSHELDEDICFEVLRRGDAAWLGLIGSVTKRRRFVHRLAGRGVSGAALERLKCPIGLAGITGKRPATIALAVAAQLLEDVVPQAWR